LSLGDGALVCANFQKKKKQWKGFDNGTLKKFLNQSAMGVGSQKK
jgi:hypothetical protein